MIVRLLIVVLLACGLAGATTITATVDPSRGEYSVWFNQHGAPADAYFAGVLLITLNQNGVNYDRDTLCVDLFTEIYVGTPYGTNVLAPGQVSGRDAGALRRAAWLIDNAVLPKPASFTSTLPAADVVETPAQGAGMQLAIWDITQDQGNGFDEGIVAASTTPGESTPADVLYWANFYENASLGKSSDLAFVYNNFSLGDGSAAQMLEGPVFQDGGPDPAPEPSTSGLGGAGLIVAACLGLRRKARY